MSMIQDIFANYGEEYLRQYGTRVPRLHRKVIRAIIECRTGKRGLHVFECPDCHQREIANSSCGNRHCPVCQHDKAVKWVERQQQNLLPCNYFLVTFPLPSGLRDAARANQKAVYSALMTKAAEALGELEADKRFVGCGISGALGVLHTWSRQMEYHPHAHFLVPGGGLDGEKKSWQSARGSFLVHVKALSRLFRGKMKDALEQAGLMDAIPREVWQNEWIAHCQFVGSGAETLKYLGAYVFKTAISDTRILACKPGTGTEPATVTFKYQKVGTSKWKKLTVPVMEFIRRFLQHVLPKGFVKVRHYGFLSPNFSVPIQRIRELICVIYELVRKCASSRRRKGKLRPLRCPKCKAVMEWKRFIRPMSVAIQT